MIGRFMIRAAVGAVIALSGAILIGMGERSGILLVGLIGGPFIIVGCGAAALATLFANGRFSVVKPESAAVSMSDNAVALRAIPATMFAIAMHQYFGLAGSTAALLFIAGMVAASAWVGRLKDKPVEKP